MVTIARCNVRALLRVILGARLLTFLTVSIACASPAACDGIPWGEWSEGIFAEARSHKRLILVNASSKACPWCRKMESGTFTDPDLQKLIVGSFLPIRVNLRARDELSPRFQNLQPPTVLVLNAEGRELVAHHGYLEADELATVLRAVLAGGLPGGERRSQWSGVPPFTPDGGVASFAMQLVKARQGDSEARKSVSQSLRYLEDRYDAVWGGVFALDNQASYKKHLEDQARAIWLFLLGSQAFGGDDYAHKAQGTARYVMRFLSEGDSLSEEQDGVVSNQIAPREYFMLDDKDRRSHGVPKKLGRASVASSALIMGVLADLYGVAGDPEFLRLAERLSVSLSSSSTRTKGDSIVMDSVSLAQGLLSLYSVTGDRRYLRSSMRALEDARRAYRASGGKDDAGSRRAFFVEVANLLARYSGDRTLLKEAQGVLSSLDGGGLDSSKDARIIEARGEFHTEPVHIVIVGAKGDPRSQALWREAIRLVHPYVRREWWDRSEGALPNPDVGYPVLDRPAAFLCFQKRCSLPLFTDSELRAKLREIVPPL